MMLRLPSILLTVLLSTLVTSGCGGGASDAPKTVPVRGIVTLDGKPLAGASVQYLPTDPKVNSFAGTTDADGKYTLSQASNSGAVPGKYKVAISLYVKADGAAVPPELQGDIEQMKMAGLAKAALPEKYMDFAITELTSTVEAGKPDGYDFKLTSN